MNKYRGDTYIFPFSLQDESGSAMKFQKDDIVRFGMKENFYTKDYALYKELKIEAETEEIQIKFEPEETSKLELRQYIIELELERDGQIDTIYQDMLTVEGDVITNEAKSNTETTTDDNSQAE